jgi:hypothetical protein
METQRLHRFFKVIGKVILYSQRGPAYSLALRKLMSGVVDQTVTGLPEESDGIVKFINPLTGSINDVIKQLDAVPAAAAKHGGSYLKGLAPALELPDTSSTSIVGAALIAEMNDQSETVMSKGAGSPPANATGFAWFFEKTWGITLPQSDTPTIPDAWIDDDVIAD